MPYKTQAEFNSSTTGKRVASHFRKGGKKPPPAVMKQFREVVNSMIKRGYSEERAIRAAWSVVNKRRKG